MDRFNSLFVFLLLSFFAVSVSTIVSSDHVVVSTDRNSTTSSEDLDLLKNVEHHFTNFIKKYGRTYADEEEHAYRLSVFKSNLRRAKRHQKLDPTAVHGITQFSDLTLMEFKRNLLGGGAVGVKRVKLLEKNVGLKAPILPTNDLPADFDWRDRRVVTPPKDQKYNSRFNFGCNGGSIYYAFEHLLNKSFITEPEYPYTSGWTRTQSSCRTASRSSINTRPRVANFSVVNSVNEDQIAANLVKNGPLAVVMKMDEKFLITHVGGVSCPLICSSKFGEHSVVLVGYGAGAYSPIRLKKEPYWILKNSWGTEWGEQGFFRTCKGNDEACGGMDHVITVATTSS